jgi:hypothetical protein
MTLQAMHQWRLALTLPVVDMSNSRELLPRSRPAVGVIKLVALRRQFARWSVSPPPANHLSR